MIVSRLGLAPASAAREGDGANPAVMLKTYAHPVLTPAEIQATIPANRQPGAKKAENG